MLSLIGLLLQAGAAPAGPVIPAAPVELPATAADPADVVVVGRRLSDAKERLEACLRRGCSPLEDMRLSSDYAQDQFIVGDYQRAYSTLYRSQGRNQRFAKQHPVEVSGLIQFKADMSVLTGHSYRGRVGAIDSLDALKAGLPATDRRILAQRLVIGDGFVRQGRLRAGSDVYDLVAKQAQDAGMSDLRGQAMLRAASLYGYLAIDNSSYASAANIRFAAIEATREPELQRYRDASALMRGRIAYDRGDREPLERRIAELEPTAAPMLVIAPKFDLRLPGCEVTGGMGFSTQEREFIDLSFLVQADGTVADVVEVRRGNGVSGKWPERLIESVGMRRYLRLALPAGSPGIHQVERFSIVREMGKATGSMVGQACGAPRIEIVDLLDGEKQRAQSNRAARSARD